MIANLLVDVDRYALHAEAGARYHETFVDGKYVRFSSFFRPHGFALLRQEADRLRRLALRRDLRMEGSGGSPRHMSTLGGHVIAEYSSLIPALYNDPDLLAFLSGVAGEPVLVVPDPVENHVLNVLHRPDDVHGGHVDTYAFAFNISIDGTTESDGGALEYVPGSVALEDLDGPLVRRAFHAPGDCYLVKTDEAVHRVSPLRRDGALRTIFNFAFANPATVGLVSYSTSALYGGQPAALEAETLAPPPEAVLPQTAAASEGG
jgi:hypothetical protein